jgi:hypothetical protein
MRSRHLEWRRGRKLKRPELRAMARPIPIPRPCVTSLLTFVAIGENLGPPPSRRWRVMTIDGCPRKAAAGRARRLERRQG